MMIEMFRDVEFFGVDLVFFDVFLSLGLLIIMVIFKIGLFLVLSVMLV